MQLVHIYTAGLVNPLKTDVALRRPTSLDDAIMLARAYEQRQQQQLSLSDPVPGQGNRAVQQSPAATAAKSAAGAASASSAALGSSRTTAASRSLLPRRRLTPSEMSQRRAEGLCFNCDEKYVQGHRCEKLFVLEVVTPGVEDDEEEEVDEVIECSALTGSPPGPGISLYAATGVRRQVFHTMKIFVSIGDAVAMAVLNSGSSHNFIDAAMARRAGVRLRGRTGLSVAVANGDRVAATGKAAAQQIFIAGEPFSIDLYGLPLGDYDMVLGVQWLGSLGPLLWDFARQTLTFERSGKKTSLRGIDVTRDRPSRP
jgi:hypothetical protein